MKNITPLTVVVGMFVHTVPFNFLLSILVLFYLAETIFDPKTFGINFLV